MWCSMFVRFANHLDCLGCLETLVYTEWVWFTFNWPKLHVLDEASDVTLLQIRKDWELIWNELVFPGHLITLNAICPSVNFTEFSSGTMLFCPSNWGGTKEHDCLAPWSCTAGTCLLIDFSKAVPNKIFYDIQWSVQLHSKNPLHLFLFLSHKKKNGHIICYA